MTLIDPVDPFENPPNDFAVNPHKYYEALRSLDPIWRSPRSGQWIVTGYEAVSDLLRDARIDSQLFQPSFEKELSQTRSLRQAQSNWISMLNGQRHDTLRKPFFDACASSAVQKLGRVIHEQTDLLLQEPSRSGQLEIIYGLACPLNTKVIAHWFGVEAEHELEFRRAVHLTCSHFSPIIPGVVQPVFQAAETLLKHINRLIDLRTKEPSDDVISIMSNHLAKNLSKTEIADNCLLIVFASYETVVHQIGNSILLLLQSPQQFDLLKEDPGLIRDALDELLRLGGPVQVVSRTVSENFQYQGKEFQAGDTTRLVLAAANRDPIFGKNPNELDFRRIFKKHLSFGLGPHFCIGAHLVRLQLETVLRTLIARFPQLRLAQATPRFHPSVGIRGLQELPVLLR